MLDEHSAKIRAKTRRGEERVDAAIARSGGSAQSNHQTAHLAQSTSQARIPLLERERNDAAAQDRRICSPKRQRSQQQVRSRTSASPNWKENWRQPRNEFAEHKNERSVRRGGAEKCAHRAKSKLLEKLNELRLALATERQRHESLVAQRQPMAARESRTRRVDRGTARGYRQLRAADSRRRRRNRENAEAAIERQTARRAERQTQPATEDRRTARMPRAASQRTRGMTCAPEFAQRSARSRGQQQVRESQLQMQIDNLAEHVERRYQVDLRAFAPDAIAFEKTLAVQLKRAEEKRSRRKLRRCRTDRTCRT